VKDLEGRICLVELRATMNTLSIDSRYSGRDMKQHLPDTSHRHHHSTRFTVSQRLSVCERTTKARRPSCYASYDQGFCLRSHVQTGRGVHTRGTSAREEHLTKGDSRYTYQHAKRLATGLKHRGSILGRTKEISLQIFIFMLPCIVI
jgi:hypothetical protein